MTTIHQRDKKWRKLVLALAIGVLIGVIAHAQPIYVASYAPNTNSAPVERFSLQYQSPTTSDTNIWFWLNDTAGTNISIEFRAPASNPVLLSVKSVSGTNESVPSETYLFDTNNFVVAKQLNLFPPRFLKVTRKP